MGVFYIQHSTLDWNIDECYSKGTLVKYEDKLYYAKKDTVKGINLGYGDYWKEITDLPDLDEILDDIAELKDDVTDINSTLQNTASVTDLSEDVSVLQLDIDGVDDDISEIENNLTANVGGTPVAFEFVWDETAQSYGYKDKDGVFHSF